MRFRLECGCIYALLTRLEKVQVRLELKFRIKYIDYEYLSDAYPYNIIIRSMCPVVNIQYISNCSATTSSVIIAEIIIIGTNDEAVGTHNHCDACPCSRLNGKSCWPFLSSPTTTNTSVQDYSLRMVAWH